MYSTPKSPKPVKRCAVCGEDFPPRYAGQKCCGKTCAKIQADRTRSARRAAARTYVCEYCGDTYEAKKPDRNRFCCREHGFLFRQLYPVERVEQQLEPMPTCKVCGKPCPTRKHKTCSHECRKVIARRKAVEYAINKHNQSFEQRVCRICGSQYVREYGNKKRYTCSDNCQDEMVRRQNRRAKQKYGNTLNARGREKVRAYWGTEWKAHYEHINRSIVYKRDGMRCQLCGMKVRKSSKYQDDQASIDHIVPLSIGGDHKYANVQTCCMRCNGEKGATIAGQMRLIG